MKRCTSLLLVISACLYTLEGVAYEVDTHEKLSEMAAKNSILSSKMSILKDLGLPPSIEDNNDLLPNSKGKPRNILNLIKDGARFEDTISKNRPINHFFNPLNGAPLTIQGLSLPNHPSPNWALENFGQIEGLLGVGKQEFSYSDANQYFYSALTRKAEREKNFGLMFQALGMVIHHVQDMAQPQHVRNDAHLDQFSLGGLNPLYNPSLYEQFTNRDDVRPGLPYSGYAPVYPANANIFNTPRSFWTAAGGEGLAQFTNSNFVSAGTNFDIPSMFNFPLFDPNLRTDMDIQQLCSNAKPPCPNSSLAGTMSFHGTWVNDPITGTKTLNPMASTYSIFSADLQKINNGPAFTLNRWNFALAHNFLIPRAVAYSAGLINYFFRGAMDLTPTTSPPYMEKGCAIQNLGTEQMYGTFELFDADLDEFWRMKGNYYQTVDPGGSLPFLDLDRLSLPRNYPEGVINAMLVFTGEIGGTYAVVGKKKKLKLIGYGDLRGGEYVYSPSIEEANALKCSGYPAGDCEQVSVHYPEPKIDSSAYTVTRQCYYNDSGYRSCSNYKRYLKMGWACLDP